MLRFLKKRFKFSKNPVPPENPAHQNTDTGAECGMDTEGGYRSRDLRAEEADGADSTVAPDLNVNHGGDGGGSRIPNQDSRSEDQQFPAQNASTPAPRHEGDNTGECGWL